jgi:hypothetical protein
MKLTTSKLRQIIKEEIAEVQGLGLQGDTTAPDKDPNNPLSGPTTAPDKDPNNPLSGPTVAANDDPLSGPTAAPDKQPVVAAMKKMSNRINAIEKLITKLIKNR